MRNYQTPICLFCRKNVDTRTSLEATLFFNWVSVLLNVFINWASNVAWLLLNTYNHHYTETHILVYFCPCIDPCLFMSYIYDLFMSYIYDLCDFLFSLIFIAINHITSFNRRICFCTFFRISHYFWTITWMKKANNFQIAKVKPQGVT